ncbi:MAG: hypothetical protein ACYS4T_18890 [Planctomycetota bacterium]
MRRSVANKRKRLAGRLLIADSKKAYSKSLGIKHLERTVLAALRCLGREPATLTELIELLCPGCLERLSDYPWYRDAGSQPILTDVADKAIASAVLADDLTSNGIELLALKSCCLDVAYYNKMVGGVKNKASVLFTATSRLVKQAFMELKILRESPAASSYELQTDGRGMRLHFVVGADDRFLPVSLASMVSKYLRELLIGHINRYFTGFSADLRPTAGYWKDGSRFIEDLKTNLPHVKYDNNQLIRSR